MTLTLCFILVVFGHTSAAVIISVELRDSDGTFAKNTPIKFFHQKSLGEGNCGTVLLVERGIPAKPYALKKATVGEESSLINEWEAANRTSKEARGQARIIKIYGIGKASGDVLEGDVLLMEYVDFSNLYELEFEQNKTTLEMILSVGLGLVNCFEILSESGVYHMDVKPDNILYNPATKELVLLDLGYAYFESSLVWKDTKTFRGTAPFMCPCLLTQQPNHKCDIRSMLFMLAVPKFYGSLPWLSLCHDIKNQQHLFSVICAEKENFENGLNEDKTLGNVLKPIFLQIRDEVLRPETMAVDYMSLKTVFTTGLENLKNHKVDSHKEAGQSKDKGKKGNNGKTGKKYEVDLFLNADESMKEKKGEKEKSGKRDKKMEMDLLQNSTDECKDDNKGKKEKSFSRLSGIKLKISSLKNFVRRQFRRSNVTVKKSGKE